MRDAVVAREQDALRADVLERRGRHARGKVYRDVSSLARQGAQTNAPVFSNQICTKRSKLTPGTTGPFCSVELLLPTYVEDSTDGAGAGATKLYTERSAISS